MTVNSKRPFDSAFEVGTIFEIPNDQKLKSQRVDEHDEEGEVESHFLFGVPELITYVASFLNNKKDILSFEAAAKSHIRYTSYAWKKLNQAENHLRFKNAEIYIENQERANYFFSKGILKFISSKNLRNKTLLTENEALISRYPIIKEIFLKLFDSQTSDHSIPEEFINSSEQNYIGDTVLCAWFSSANSEKFFDYCNLAMDRGATRVSLLAIRMLANNANDMVLEGQENHIDIEKILQEKMASLALRAAGKHDYLAIEKMLRKQERLGKILFKEGYRYAPILLEIAYNYAIEKDEHNANRYLKEALEAYGEVETLHLLSRTATIKYLFNELEQADSIFEKILFTYKKVPLVVSTHALRKKIESRKWQEAEQIFHAHISHKNRISLDDLCNAAVAKIFLGKFSEAEELYLKIPKSDESNLEAEDCINIAYTKLHLKKWEEAKNFYSKAQEKDPDALRLSDMYNIASAEEALENWEEADRYYQLIISDAKYNTGLNAEHLGRASIVKIRLGKWQEAESLYREAQEKDPDALWLSDMYNIALAEEADRYYQLIISDAKYNTGLNAEHLSRASIVKIRLGKWQEAESLYREAVSRSTDIKGVSPLLDYLLSVLMEMKCNKREEL
ncbi:hypothetical protein PHSC3_000032 [Chlamydiales bacterium STE3]|nr:hypothetical protein PHSC3_000032 [Chlamydiales bacterium STE3]